MLLNQGPGHVRLRVRPGEVEGCHVRVAPQWSVMVGSSARQPFPFEVQEPRPFRAAEFTGEAGNCG